MLTLGKNATRSVKVERRVKSGEKKLAKNSCFKSENLLSIQKDDKTD